MYGHRLEVYTLVSEILDNVKLVFHMKNVFELEDVIDMWDSSFKFLNRSIPFFSKEHIILKPKRTEVYQNRSTIYRSDIRACYGKNVGQQRTMYSSVETKVHKKLSIAGHYK